MSFAHGGFLFGILRRSMEKIHKIGLFDSGLGGLTVLKALEDVLPQVPKIYYGDTLHLPYGDKSDEAIIGYSLRIVEFLRQQGCDVIVIACNSASAAAGAVLEQTFPSLIFVNVIDPVVEALANSNEKKVGLLGTRATVRSEEYPRRLSVLSNTVELVSLPTPLLVPLIEDGFLGSDIAEQVLRHYLNSPSFHGISSIVPGCTHYPLLKELAQKVLKDVRWIDAPEIVAAQVMQWWNSQSRLNQPTEHAGTQFFVSDKTESFMNLAQVTFGISATWETAVLS